jgi:GxxExxY protein
MNHRGTETGRNTEFKSLSEREVWLTTQIIGISILIHKQLGPGLLESVYEKCFCHELAYRNIPFQRQVKVDLYYNGFIIDDGLRIDILVDDLIVIELKAQDIYHPIWEAQLLSYLKLTKRRLGYIMNFHVPLMKHGIKRMII